MWQHHHLEPQTQFYLCPKVCVTANSGEPAANTSCTPVHLQTDELNSQVLLPGPHPDPILDILILPIFLSHVFLD